MHLKKDFITQTIGDKQMMIAVGSEAEKFPGMIKSNETAAFIIDQLKQETTKEKIVAAVLAEYEADEAAVKADVDKVLEKLKSIGAVEE